MVIKIRRSVDNSTVFECAKLGLWGSIGHRIENVREQEEKRRHFREESAAISHSGGGGMT